ncbi:MAG: cysteine desulfurase [Clostridia bacterium]|nr:cysteine desulfurase [Clostridia bacterium]
MAKIDDVRAGYGFFARHPGRIYLDSAATSLCSDAVLRAGLEFDAFRRASPYRGLYEESVEATDAYEGARETVRSALNARFAEEIVFTRGATEGFNLLAHSLRDWVKAGDEILIGEAEHHSNMLPWRELAKARNASVRYLPAGEDGRYDPETLKKELRENTRILCVTHVSNVLGQVNDLAALCAVAHQNGVLVVADAAQSAPHRPLDVQALGVDYLCFSGHKCGSAMGIGVLYGRLEQLEALPPLLYGGEMVDYVEEWDAQFAPLPRRMEAGTVNVSGALTLAAAFEHMAALDWAWITSREQALTKRLADGVSSIPHVRLLGANGPHREAIAAFTVEDVHPHDVAQIMDAHGVCIRAGHHCAQVLHRRLGLPGSNRASLMFYNTEAEIDAFLEALSSVRKEMGL